MHHIHHNYFLVWKKNKLIQKLIFITSSLLSLFSHLKEKLFFLILHLSSAYSSKIYVVILIFFNGFFFLFSFFIIPILTLVALFFLLIRWYHRHIIFESSHSSWWPSLSCVINLSESLIMISSRIPLWKRSGNLIAPFLRFPSDYKYLEVWWTKKVFQVNICCENMLDAHNSLDSDLGVPVICLFYWIDVYSIADYITCLKYVSTFLKFVRRYVPLYNIISMCFVVVCHNFSIPVF